MNARPATIDRRPWWHAAYLSGRWGPAGAILLPLSLAYGALAYGRHLLYRRASLRPEGRGDDPYVVSIGNLELGGTGKTPFTLELARRLSAEVPRTVIVTRGYGVSVPEGVRCLDEGSGAGFEGCGDEGSLYRRALPGVPLILAPRRLSGIEAARARYAARIVLLDDAFQHLRAPRDLDILLLSAACPFGNGRLLPSGPLREGRWALGRADVVCLTGPGLPSPEPSARPAWLPDRVGLCLEAWGVPEGLTDLGGTSRAGVEAIGGVPVVALSGIARAEAFEESLRALGAEVRGVARFADHHPYTRGDLERVESLRGEVGAEWIVTTAKDAVRIDAPSAPTAIRVLHRRFEIHGLDRLVARILENLG